MDNHDDSGRIFPNTTKRSEKSADWSGKALINGVEYYLDGWVKQGITNNWLSLAFKPIQRKEDRNVKLEAAPVIEEREIPF